MFVARLNLSTTLIYNISSRYDIYPHCQWLEVKLLSLVVHQIFPHCQWFVEKLLSLVVDQISPHCQWFVEKLLSFKLFDFKF